MRGRSKTDWWGVVLEAPDAHALADFYSSLLGWPISKQDPGGTAIQVPGPSSYLSFDNAPDYAPPVWPATPGHQRMMMHIDIDIDIAVDDLAAAVANAARLGETLADFQPQEDVRVLLDPAGHPFCRRSAPLTSAAVIRGPRRCAVLRAQAVERCLLLGHRCLAGRAGVAEGRPRRRQDPEHASR